MSTEGTKPAVRCSALLGEVWVITGVDSRTGKWWVHSVHADEGKAQRDMDASNRNSAQWVCFAMQQWTVIPPNEKLTDAPR